MTAGGTGNKFQICIPLLPQANHSKGALGAANGFRQDHTALIQDHPKPNAPLFQSSGDLVSAGAVCFLRAGGKEIDILLGRKPLFCQFVTGLEHTPQTALGIQRSTTPDLTLSNRAGEGRILPVTGGFHHVHMIHQKNGRFIPFAFPAQQHTAVKIFIFTSSKQVGKLRPQNIAECIKFGLVSLIFCRYGLHLNQSGQPLCVYLGAGVRHNDRSFSILCRSLYHSRRHKSTLEQG